MDMYIIAHDLGTSGNKATLFTTEGKLVNSCTYEYGTRFFNGNWAEQNPNNWWEAFCCTNRMLLKGIDKSKVAVVSFSGQMMGCVCVDRKGEALSNAIIWADQRSTKEEEYLKNKIDELEFYRLVGHKISSSYSLEKLMWIRNNKPDIYNLTYKMLLPKDYLIYKLTGEFVTDYSDASGTNAFDLINLKWSEKIIETAEVELSKFPEALPSTTVAGEVSKYIAEESGLAAGTKVVIGGGDGVCATVGAASISENVAYNYLGSSSWISYTSKEPVFDDKLRVFNWVHLIPGYYSPTGTMQAAANSFNFVKNLLYETDKVDKTDVYKIINNEIEKSKIGANGLLFLPYLLGERSPRWNPDARGAFIGLKMEHNRGDLIRSTVEGVLMNLNIILGILNINEQTNSINVIGGMAQSDAILKILSEVFGLKVKKLSYLEEATSIGAAVTAGVGSGELNDFSEVDKFISVSEEIVPDMHNNQKYTNIKQVFDNSYHALLEIYEDLKNI